MPPVIVAAVTGAAMAAGTAAAAGTLFTMATVTAMATSAAISAALAGAAMVLSPKAKPFTAEAKDRMVSVRQAIAPRQRIYGEVRTGGPIVFLQSTSDHTGANKNKWLHLIIPLASHAVEAITDVFFDDDLLPLGADGYVTGGKYYYKGDLGGHWQSTWQRSMVYIKKYLGAADQTADPVLLGAFGSKWTADHRGRGIAYLYCRLEYNRDIFTSGIPNITAIVKGARVFDPRDGLTKWSDNAALCLMDFLKLPVQQGGVGAPNDEFDNTHWSAAANICDELVPAGDATERRYTVNGTIAMSSANTPRNSIESMLTAMAGGLVYSGGKWRCLPAVYRAPIHTLTEDDLRGTPQVQTRISRRDTFNCVKGSYSGRWTNWQPADYPSLVSDTGIAEDGGEPIWRELDRPFTNSGYACQRLAKVDYLKTRQPITVSMPCKLTAFRVQAGDVVNITNKRFGWTAKPFEVSEWSFLVTTEGELGVDLQLRETHPSIFDWNTSEEQAVDPAPGTDLPDWRNVAPPRDVDIESSNALVIEGADGSLISRALVTWTASLDGFVDTYRVQWRLNGTVDWLNQGETQALFFPIDNMPVGTIIDCRVQAVNALGIGSDWVTIFAHQISGYSDRANPAVTGLRVVGSANGTWNALDVTFAWDATPIGAIFDTYVIEIRNTAGNTLRRTVETRDAMYVYDYSANSVDGLSRAITIVVRVRTTLAGTANNLSLPASLAATNPAPPLPTAISLIGSFNVVSLRFVRPPDQDWTGTLVWRSTTTNFVRNSASLIYDGPDTDIFTTSAPGTTYYYRLAAYDAFGKVGLNESAEIAVTTGRVSHADLATEIIDSSNLIPALNTEIGKIAVLGTDITEERTLRETADQSLAQQITTISATASTGFNASALWYFDTGNDGWTALNCTTAWQSAGTLRITPTAADHYIASPTIAINGAQNRFVKVKITRVSGTTNTGNHQLYFTTSGHSYSESHTKLIAVSALAIGESRILNFDMQGTGDWSSSTITRIRFDPLQATGNVFDVDFIAIGSEGPAIGSAVFESRIKTVVDANTVTAESVETLQTTVGQNTASIQTQQTSIGGLEAQWTVKTDVNNYVSGFGLATTVRDGTPTSSFIVSADRFAVAKPGTGGLGPTIPFIIKTIGSTPQLSFTGWARFDQLESGTITTQSMFVGDANIIIDGPSRSIRVNNGTRDLVRIGRQSDNSTYGITITAPDGSTILTSGGGVQAGKIVGNLPATQVSGLGTLAGQNSVTVQQVSGLGALATANTVSAGAVSGLSSFATLSQITKANASTYIANAALNSAHIETLTAGQLASGVMRSDTFIQAGDNLILDGQSGGRFYIRDPNNAYRLRVYAGHYPGVDYGFWLWNYQGTEIFGTSGLNGTFIRDLTVGTLKIANEAVIIPRSSTTTVARSGTGTGAYQQAISFSFTLPQPARVIFIATVSQGFPSGPKTWGIRGQIYLNNGQAPFIDRGGGAYNDAPSLSFDHLCPAGTHTAALWWFGQDSTVKFYNGNIIVMGCMK